jgi:SAM-dependent methyltransferase
MLRAWAAEIDMTNRATFDLLDAAAAVYPRIARGEVDGASALLAAEHINLWLAYFNNDHPLYALNNRVSAVAAAERLVGERPISERPLRILEIGAGAGSGTECLLHELARRSLLDHVEYFLVTEPSAFFRRRGARSLSASYPDVPLEFAALDIDEPWATQGAPRGAFDLVFGVNVLHVATDLPFTLSEVRAALAPGGWLVAGECLRPFPQYPIYIELVFQTLDSFVDVVTDPELRPRPGFLTPEEWRRLLVQAGFGRIELSPDHIATREIYPKLFVGALCARRHDGSEKVAAHASTSAMGS